MKRWTLVLLWLAVLLVFSTGIVLAQGSTDPLTQDPLWQVMAPIIAIATTTERVLEMFWGRWEKAGMWPNSKGVPDRKNADYIFHKQQISQWIGTVFALVAIGLTNARFFRLLGLDVLFSNGPLLFTTNIGGIFDNFTLGTLIDWGLTAAIIGWGGTELVHNIIEGLIKGRGLWKETQEVRSGERQLTDTKLFYDYVLPQMEKIGIAPSTFYQLTGWLREVDVPLDELISAAAANSMDAFFTKLEATPQGARASEALHNLMERESISTDTLVQIPNLMALLNPDVCKRLSLSCPPES